MKGDEVGGLIGDVRGVWKETKGQNITFLFQQHNS